MVKKKKKVKKKKTTTNKSVSKKAFKAESKKLYAKYKELFDANVFSGTGKCKIENCDCTYFLKGDSKPTCYNCSHSPLYHEIIIKKEEEKIRMDENVQKLNEKKLKVNKFPCSIEGCDCDRYVNSKSKYTLPLSDLLPKRLPSVIQEPAICNLCNHADIYHIQQSEEELKKKKKLVNKNKYFIFHKYITF